MARRRNTLQILGEAVRNAPRDARRGLDRVARATNRAVTGTAANAGRGLDRVARATNRAVTGTAASAGRGARVVGEDIRNAPGVAVGAARRAVGGALRGAGSAVAGDKKKTKASAGKDQAPPQRKVRNRAEAARKAAITRKMRGQSGPRGF